MGGGEFDPEAAAVIGLRLDAGEAAHAFDAFADDGKADAGAWVARAVQAFEYAEDAFVLVRGDANAVVLEPEASFREVGIGPELEVWLAAGRDEFEAVGEKVGEALGEGGFVSEDGREGNGGVDLGGSLFDLGITLEESVIPAALERDCGQLDF